MKVMEFSRGSAYALTVTLAPDTPAGLADEIRQAKTALLDWKSKRQHRCAEVLFTVSAPADLQAEVESSLRRLHSSEGDVSAFLQSLNVEVGLLDPRGRSVKEYTLDASQAPAGGDASHADGAATSDSPAADIWTSYSTRARALLAIGSILSGILFWLAGEVIGFPRYEDFQASLLIDPKGLFNVLIVAVVLVVCVVGASLITRSVHFDAGLFCAALGMIALSVRGGPMRYVLMYNPSSGVFLRLAIETALLLACVAAGWYALLVLRDRGVLKGEPIRDDDPDALPAQGLMALVAQIILITFLVALLAQTDKKSQVLWSIGIATSVSAVAAHSLFPARPSIWFWSAPFLIGILGYVLAFFGGDPEVGGKPAGVLAGLARPLPLDYASIGTAGSLLGYWTSRKWLHDREGEPHTTGEVEEALDNPQGT